MDCPKQQCVSAVDAELCELLKKSVEECFARAKELAVADFNAWVECWFDETEDYQELWELFDAVMTTSCYGCSAAKGAVAGPIWVMDFSWEHLMMLCPSHPWLKMLQPLISQAHDIGRCVQQQFYAKFQRWFAIRVHSFIMGYGLHNVLVKFTPNESVNMTPIRFYSSAAFLVLLRVILKRGYIVEVSEEALSALRENMPAYAEFSRGNYLTFMAADDGFASCYPSRECCGESRVSSRYFQDKYCYPLFHFSWTNEHVFPIYGVENYLPRIVYDLLDDMLELKVPLEELPKLMSPSEKWLIRKLKGDFLNEPSLGVKLQSKVWYVPNDFADEEEGWKSGKFVEPMKLWNYEGKHTFELHLPCANTIDWYKNFTPSSSWKTVASRCY